MLQSGGPAARRPRRRARRPRPRAVPGAIAPRTPILERAGLTALVNRRAETLSGGEAQRVRFAFAIAGDPDLVFLDEPTVAMDVEARRAFWEDMRRFAAEGRTVLFATHYLDEADHVADRIVVLDHGRIVGRRVAGRAEGDGHRARRPVRALEPPMRRATRCSAGLPGVLGVERHGASLSLPTRDADATVRALVACRRRVPPPRGRRRRPRRRVPRADVRARGASSPAAA